MSKDKDKFFIRLIHALLDQGKAVYEKGKFYLKTDFIPNLEELPQFSSKVKAMKKKVAPLGVAEIDEKVFPINADIPQKEAVMGLAGTFTEEMTVRLGDNPTPIVHTTTALHPNDSTKWHLKPQTIRQILTQYFGFKKLNYDNVRQIIHRNKQK